MSRSLMWRTARRDVLVWPQHLKRRRVSKYYEAGGLVVRHCARRSSFVSAHVLIKSEASDTAICPSHGVDTFLSQQGEFWVPVHTTHRVQLP